MPLMIGILKGAMSNRRVTVRCLIVAAMACPMLMSMQVLAGEQIDETKATSADVRIRIHNPRGEVDIRGWDKDAIRIQGELDDLTEKFVFDVTNRHAIIDVRLPRRNARWGDGSDLEIMIPRSALVDFRGISTSLRVTDLQGGLRAHNVSGEVSVSGIDSKMMIKTMSGGIDVQQSSARANISTMSGKIEIDMDSRHVEIDSVSGSVDVALASFDMLRIQVVSGEVGASGQLLAGGELSVSSVSSEVDIELRKPVDADVLIGTGPGGTITNDLSDVDAVSTFPARMTLKDTVGSGAGRLRVRTVAGHIHLRPAD
jgi:hypothetical protein